VLKDGEIITAAVEIGNSNDSQTEIVSGINEGDEIITSVITADMNTKEKNTASPFSDTGSGRTMMGPPGGF
jgi:hypothetical protein